MKRAIFIMFLGLTPAAFAQRPVAGSPAAPSSSFSGAERVQDLVTEPSKSLGFALLDPSRLRMSQSYSLTYFSGSGYSGSVGMYMNTLEYQLFRPLTVRVGLGYLHQPFGAGSGGAALTNDRFLPNVSLEYRPSDNFRLMLDYRTVPVAWNHQTGAGLLLDSGRPGWWDRWSR